MRTIARTHLAHHLLAARTHGGVTELRAPEGFDASGDAPLSSELRHCTAYPESHPEATWAQPLGREELSWPGASFDVRGQWPVSMQTPHLPRCLRLHPGTGSGAGQTLLEKNLRSAARQSRSERSRRGSRTRRQP